MFKVKAEESLLFREREILRTLSMLSQTKLEFVVVGGYAVATAMHRFSVDLDIVVKEDKCKKFEEILAANGYSLTHSKEMSLVYGEKFRRFEKSVEGFPVNVDLLVNGVASRTTNASWAFEYIMKEASKARLNGAEFLVPSRELLIAMKIHSGRLSDARDVVALAEFADFGAVKRHALRGDKAKLKAILKNGIVFLGSKNFADSFKGVFGARFYRKESVEKAKELLKEMLKRL